MSSTALVLPKCRFRLTILTSIVLSLQDAVDNRHGVLGFHARQGGLDKRGFVKIGNVAAGSRLEAGLSL